MRRTSVMIEVNDDVYETLVEPLKRNKSFAKLISSLLNGYINDSYIRAFVDDNLEGVKKAVVGSFAESVGEMESALANMGLFTDELNAHSQAGYARFQQHRAKQVEELDKEPISSKENTPRPKDEEFEALQNRVASMEKSMSEGFSRILEILNQAKFPEIAHQATPVAQPTKVSVEERVEHSMQSHISAIPSPVRSSEKELVAVGVSGYHDEGESGSSGEETNAFLSSLVADFGVSY